jgi:hypothetical protein
MTRKREEGDDGAKNHRGEDESGPWPPWEPPCRWILSYRGRRHHLGPSPPYPPARAFDGEGDGNRERVRTGAWSGGVEAQVHERDERVGDLVDAGR